MNLNTGSDGMVSQGGYRFSAADLYLPTCKYELLPFRFDRFDGRVILVNEVGEHLFLSEVTFRRLLAGVLEPAESVYADLKGKHFIFDSDISLPLRLLSTKLRTKKSHIQGFTKLHIFVVTLRCEHSCKYCQVSRVSSDKHQFDMSREIADRSIELAFRTPSQEIKIELQGGEPLLNFPLLQQIVESAERQAVKVNKTVAFVVTTNLALVTVEMLDYLGKHSVSLSTSLDGPAFIHNANRPRPNGDSHKRTIEGIKLARSVLGHDSVSALMTATRLSLEHPMEIIDEYLSMGFDSIFLRSLSPYGFASRTGKSIGYSIEDFLNFYVKGLEYILELNRSGIRFIETYAQILLTRILTPFPTGYVDLQSPAGAGTSVAVYDYDGDVYPSDEARMLAAMGDRHFRMGNVLQDSYEKIFRGPVIRQIIENTNLESVPVCSDCAFQSFCGSDPVYHYGTQGSSEPNIPVSEFHKKHDFLFRYLLRKLDEDSAHSRVLREWVLT